jgi:hypothetical protein
MTILFPVLTFFAARGSRAVNSDQGDLSGNMQTERERERKRDNSPGF